MIIKYENSLGEIINLNKDGVMIKSANFAENEWGYTLKKNEYGVHVGKFEKNEKILEIKLAIKGTDERKREVLEDIYRITEKDIYLKKRGKLYLNDEYIECFAIYTNAEADKFFANAEIKFLCPDAAWITEKKYEFVKDAQEKRLEDLDFPFDIPFDLLGDEKGSGRIEVKHYFDCDFKMIIYGPCANPRIVIGDNIYEVKTTLDKGEYLTIDTNSGTIIRTQNSGVEVNEFNNRVTEPNSPFEKIKHGTNLISWDGSFGFDIILYIKRSVQTWKNS